MIEFNLSIILIFINADMGTKIFFSMSPFVVCPLPVSIYDLKKPRKMIFSKLEPLESLVK